MNRIARKKFLRATKTVTKAGIVAVENKLPAIVNPIIFSVCLNSILPGFPLTLLAWKENIIVNAFSKYYRSQ